MQRLIFDPPSASYTRQKQIWRHAEVHLTQKHQIDGLAYRFSCSKPQPGAEQLAFVTNILIESPPDNGISNVLQNPYEYKHD